MEQKKRVLFVGHDNLLEHEEGLEVDFLGGLGRGMGQTKAEFREDGKKKTLLVLMRFLLRRYDQVIFPSAILTRSAELGESGLKRKLASFLYRASYSKRLTKLIRGLTSFFLKGQSAAFVERFSQMTVHRHMFQFFDHSILFKTIAHREYPERKELKVVPTNYWINIDCYPTKEIIPFELRSCDVFYVGQMVFDQRRIAPELERMALDSGIKFEWLRQRLTFEEYIDRIATCKIAWSPEGSNWQCWRHYESLYYGAIPLINRPESRIFHTLVEGEHCFFYDSVEEAVEIMKGVCQGKLRLKLSQEERKRFVVEQHSEYGLGRMISRELNLRSGD